LEISLVDESKAIVPQNGDIKGKSEDSGPALIAK
jgi:hypothetical protein